MHTIQVKGVIVPNDYKIWYDYLEQDSTCVNDVQKVLTAAKGEDVTVSINSPGGVIDVGSEIYTMLRSYEGKVTINILGQACSAASIIAMAGECYMSPTALMMVHCVSTGLQGNHSDFEHTAEMLRIADEALCTAYTLKTGMTKEQALEMMEYETWLTAEQAKEKGLIDGIMFEEKQDSLLLTACNIKLPTEEQMNNLKAMINKQDIDTENNDPVFLIQQKNKMEAKLRLLNLKEEIRV